MSVLQSFLAGREARRQQDAVDRMNQMQAFLANKGQAVMAGDTGALGQLAGFGVEGFNLATTARAGARADEMHGLQVKNIIAQMSAREAAAEAANLERAVQAGLGTTSNEQWNAMVEPVAPELVGQWENRHQIAMGFVPVIEQLRMQAESIPEPYQPQSSAGKLAEDLRRGVLTPEQYATATEKTPLVDQSGMTIGNQGSGVTDNFYEKLDTGMAATFSSLIDRGMQVPTNVAQLDEMETLLSNAPAGAEASLKYLAGQFGIETEGLNELQAAQALINRMVPAQRPPGSGPMSDADLALFKQSLPQLINTREGNTQIIRTLRGIAIYELKQAEIATAVATRQMTPAEGLEALAQLENPLAWVRKKGATTIGGYTIRETTQQDAN